MDATLASVIIAAFTVLGAMVGWFQLQKKLEIRKLDNAIELEEVKKQNTKLIFEAEMGLLEAHVSRLQSDLETFKKSVEASVKLINGGAKTHAQTIALGRVMLKALQKFTEDTDKRFTWVESKFRDVDSLHMQFEERLAKIELGRVTVIDTTKKG